MSSKVKIREGLAQDEVVRFEKAAGGADGAWLLFLGRISRLDAPQN